VAPLFLALLISSALAGAGCTVAGLAAGTLVGAIQAVSERSVERTLPVDLSTAWAATADAFARMAVPVSETDRSGDRWMLRGTSANLTVHAELRPVTPGMTKLLVRVEAGGLLADKKTGEEILGQVAAALRPAPGENPRDPAAPESAVGEALRMLQRDIQRLGSRIEEMRVIAPRHLGPSTTPLSTEASRVIRVPTSAGVPHHPAAEMPGTPASPPIRSTAGSAPQAASQGLPTAVGTAGQLPAEMASTPLSPVEELVPIGVLVTKPSSP